MFKKMKKKASESLNTLMYGEGRNQMGNGLEVIEQLFREERPQSEAQLLSPYNTMLHRDDIVDAERLKIREQLYAEFDKLLDPSYDAFNKGVIQVSTPHEHLWFTTFVTEDGVQQKCACDTYRHISQDELFEDPHKHTYKRRDGKLYVNVVMFRCTTCDDEYEMERWKWEALLKGHIKL